MRPESMDHFNVMGIPRGTQDGQTSHSTQTSEHFQEPFESAQSFWNPSTLVELSSSDPNPNSQNTFKDLHLGTEESSTAGHFPSANLVLLGSPDQTKPEAHSMSVSDISDYSDVVDVDRASHGHFQSATLLVTAQPLAQGTSSSQPLAQGTSSKQPLAQGTSSICHNVSDILNSEAVLTNKDKGKAEVPIVACTRPSLPLRHSGAANESEEARASTRLEEAVSSERGGIGIQCSQSDMRGHESATDNVVHSPVFVNTNFPFSTDSLPPAPRPCEQLATNPVQRQMLMNNTHTLRSMCVDRGLPTYGSRISLVKRILRHAGSRFAD
jgi:hypothetical protein